MLGGALVTVPAASAAPHAISTSAPGAATPTPIPPSPSPQPPSAPGNLTAVARTTSITLSWTASQPGCCAVTRYEFSYIRAFDDVMIGGDPVTDTTVTVTNYILPATEYRFRVTARDTAGNYSASASITVVTPATDTGPDTVPPTAPSGLTGTATGSSIALAWSPSTDNVGVTGYRVYHYDGWYTSRLLATVTGTTFTAPLGTGRNNYYVRAVDAAGNVSIASNVINAPAGSPPPTIPPTTIPPTTTPPTTPSADTCQVTYLTQSEWPGGFTASIAITNTSSTAIDGWTLAFTFGGDQQVATGWSATYAQTGPEVTAQSLPWNAVIRPDARVSIGFVGTWNSSNSPPTRFTLNGNLCETASA